MDNESKSQEGFAKAVVSGGIGCLVFIVAFVAVLALIGYMLQSLGIYDWVNDHFGLVILALVAAFCAVGLGIEQREKSKKLQAEARERALRKVIEALGALNAGLKNLGPNELARARRSVTESIRAARTCGVELNEIPDDILAAADAQTQTLLALQTLANAEAEKASKTAKRQWIWGIGLAVFGIVLTIVLAVVHL